MKNIFNCMRKVIISILIILGALIYAGFRYVRINFGVSIDELLNTLLGPLEGTGSVVIRKAVLAISPYVLLGMVIILVLLIAERLVKKKCERRTVIWFYIIDTLFAFSVFALSLLYGQIHFEIIQYLRMRNEKSTIYEEYYVPPQLIDIEAPTQKRNLIMIYLESMEATYASVEEGGLQEVNYIPHLTEMAYENDSFSNTDKLGGPYQTVGTGWTMAGLLASSSGVPYSIPINGNDMSTQELFVSGLYTMGDFLYSEGYHNMFLCGSTSAFAGRDKYYRQHGNYEIYDYDSAVNDGYTSYDQYVWWGLEDYRLYEIAQDKLLQLAQEDAPFNLTMLTVDTHHVSGWVCPKCEGKYDVQLANVVSCADNLVYEFIEWCKEQSFYENTTIVIVGDHYRMDNDLVVVPDDMSYRRSMYNCYINSAVSCDADRKRNRLSITEDIFPTTLAAMGYKFNGNRLGLGTNLFSNEKTLLEEFGIESLSAMLAKGSDYYVKNFAPETMFDSKRWDYGSGNEKLHIYFCGDNYNIEEIQSEGIAERELEYSWTSGNRVAFTFPFPNENLFFSLKTVGTAEEQHYELLCDGVKISEGVIDGYGYIEAPLENPNGTVNVEILLPDAKDVLGDGRLLGLKVFDLVIY